MNKLRMACLISVLAVSLFNGTANAMVRKPLCLVTPGGLPILNETMVVMEHGKIVGDFGSPGLRPPGDQILFEVMSCMDINEAGQIVGRRVVEYVTKDGVVSFMKSYLGSLAESQEMHLVETGAYARSLDELDFFKSSPRLPIQLTGGVGGWSATFRLVDLTLPVAALRGTSPVCTVTMEKAGFPRSALPQDVVTCQG